MVNGQTLTSVKPLKEIYENAAIGDVLKLGILRDQKMKMVKFKKADPDELPGDMKISISDGSDDPVASTLLDAGLMLTAENGQIVVQEIIKELIPEFTGHTPQIGDAIVKLQENEVESPEVFAENYKQIRAGEMISLTLIHDGLKVESSFKKPTEAIKQKIIHKVK